TFVTIQDTLFVFLDGRNLCHVWVRVRGSAGHRTVRVYGAVNLPTTFHLEPCLVALGQLRDALLHHQVFGEELAWRVLQLLHHLFVHLRLAAIGEHLGLPPVELHQPIC